MKRDITKLMNRYRECVRHLWNMYFLEQLSSENQWDTVDAFDEICTLLFSSLVLNPVGCTSHKKSHRYEQFPQPLPCIHVVLLSELGPSAIHINREKMKMSGYWDYPINLIKPSDIEVYFIDCFDFDKLGYKDVEYYLVRIVGSSEYPDLIGRNALIKTSSVKIVFVDESESIEEVSDWTRQYR